MFKGFTDQRSSRLLALLFGLMIAVLLVLGFLQYRWISEASDAAERQLRESLDISVGGFVQDFEDQLRSVGAAFRQPRAGEEKTDHDIADQYRKDYDNWIATASVPELLQDGFLVKPQPQGKPVLFHFDLQTNRFEPIEWPQELSGLSQTYTGGFRGFPAENVIAASVPAVVISLFGPGAGNGPMRRPPDRGAGPRLRGFPPFGGQRRGPPPRPFGPPSDRQLQRGPEDNEWLVLRFNREVFQNKFLPQLVSRHFSSAGESIYDLLIVATLKGTVFYRSAPGLTAGDFRLFDASAPLREPDLDRPPRGGPPLRDGGLLPSGWQLLVRHRMGSLKVAVQQLRRRNTAVGIAILALLGGGLIATWLASERVRSLGQMQIELAAGISHELRTPLTVIRSAGYNMAAGHVVGREDIVRYGNLFQEQGRRLSEVVEQALLFAQTHSGKNSYALQPVDAAAIVSKVVESCKSVDAAGNRLDIRISPDLPLGMTDGTALSHCLHNLVVNALKYGDRHGQVVIEVQPLDNKPGREIEIVVTDTGPGIDRHDLPHIFDPFYRGGNSANIEGNGLGLYLVRRTMASIQGRVTVSSAPGKGSRFTLYVPAVPEDGIGRS